MHIKRSDKCNWSNRITNITRNICKMAKKTDSLTNERKWSETKSACVECSEISTNVSCAGNRFSVYLLSIAFPRPERHSPETKQAMFFSLSNEYTMCWFTSVMTWGFILFEFLYLDGKQISWKNNQRQSAIACSIFLLASIFIPCAALLKVHMHFRKIQNVSRDVYSLSKPYQYRTVHICRSLFENLH